MRAVAPTSLGRLVSLATALVCGALGLALARHYPADPLLTLTLWSAVAALGFAGWQVLPMLLPALVPLIGLAPFTGWITFEELDLLVLAVACGGYAALALTESSRRPEPWRYRTLRWRAAVRVLMAVFTLSAAIAVWRGLEQAGGAHFGWWQGYQEAMNSVRLGKTLALVLLLLPLWQRAADLRPAAVLRLNRAAWVLVLVAASAAATWERWVYTGLLNFSSDYRTTAGFWEMHVGGAALDGCLALSAPMALLWVLGERRPLRFIGALAVLLLGFYASLTTFSRGVYLAVPIGLALCALLWTMQRREGLAEPRGASGRPLVPAEAALPPLWCAVLLAAVGLAAWVLFGAGGYRGLLALAGSAAVWVAMPARRAAWPDGQRRSLLVLSLVPALAIAGVGALLVDSVPKLAYALDALVVLGTLALCGAWRRGMTQPVQALLMAAGWMASLACAWLVALQWGGGRDAGLAAGVLVLLALGWIATQWSPRPIAALRQSGWRVRGLLWTACVLVCGVIAALGGGGYIGQRMSTGQQDFEGRLDHWRLGLSLLGTTDEWLLGKGAGRFTAAFANGGPFEQRVGDYRWNPPADPAQEAATTADQPQGPSLTLMSGMHQLGHGEMFRVSQVVPAVGGDVAATLVLRTRQQTRVRVEICEKHLLYPMRCIEREQDVQPQGNAWQTIQMPLGRAPDDFGGPRYAPRRLTAAVSMNWRGSLVELRAARLVDSRHGPLLRNDDFSDGMAHWFFSSDRVHMPFHMKSLPLHVLFEQGVLGFSLWVALLASALWRCSLGAARHHPLAPALTGGLAGFLVVGLFDSLVDAPRIAFLFYAMLALALGLRTPSRRRQRRGASGEGDEPIETQFADADADLDAEDDEHGPETEIGRVDSRFTR